MAAARQDLPVRLDRAPQRGAAFAITRPSRRARTRSIGSRSRARGSSLIFDHPPAVALPPSPGPAHYLVARDHRLPALRHVHLLMNVLHRNRDSDQPQASTESHSERLPELSSSDFPRRSGPSCLPAMAFIPTRVPGGGDCGVGVALVGTRRGPLTGDQAAGTDAITAKVRE
jgi:hypothetical protein